MINERVVVFDIDGSYKLKTIDGKWVRAKRNLKLPNKSQIPAIKRVAYSLTKILDRLSK
jgi:hypothetical protein